MEKVDFDLLQKRIAVASRRSFDQVRAAHPGERLYAFALYASDDAVSVCPSVNSEEAYGRLVRRREADTSQRQWLADHGISFESFLLVDGRWSAYEWEYECDGADEFRAVNELINNGGTGFYDHDDSLGFVRFKGRVFASMVLALLDLDSTGYFGTGRARESVTVFCSVPHSFCTVWLEDDSARRLIPKSVYRVFKKGRIDLIRDGMDEEDSSPDSVFGVYLAHLRK